MSTSNRAHRQSRSVTGSLSRRRRAGDDSAPQRTRLFKRWVQTFGPTAQSAQSRRLFIRDAVRRAPMWSHATRLLVIAAVVHLTTWGDADSSGPTVNVTDTLNREGTPWA
jgi:hypothetical protein